VRSHGLLDAYINWKGGLDGIFATDKKPKTAIL
jgi:hypothetical protein